MFRLGTRFLALVQTLSLLSAVRGYSFDELRARAISVDAVAPAYDYIVVGGGQSGLVIASRLSEDPKKTILVVEYGSFADDPAQLEPSSGTIYNMALMYNVTSVPQPALNGRTGGSYAAAVVGGGSTINGMLFDRGAAEDYDNWERLGNPGWGWKDLYPYFKKSTTFTPPRADLAKEYNVTWDTSAYGKGPIQATYPDWLWPAVKTQWRAWEELGIEIQKEGNAGKAYGAYWVPSNVDQSYRRSYARNGYYEPASSRRNLHLITGQRVNEVLFDAKRRATAVTIQPRGTPNKTPTITVKAKQEIVLTAGWLHTPQILQRSGIGPKPLLEEADVKVLVDAPGVGSNLQDHPAYFAQFAYLTDAVPSQLWMYTNATFQAWAAELWRTERKGPLSVGVGNTLGTIPYPDLNPDYKKSLANWAAQKAAGYLPKTYTSAQIRGYLAQRKLLLSTFSKKNNGIVEIPFSGGASTALVLEKPASRGTILLNTTDVYAEPILDFNTNVNPFDLDVAVASIRFYRKWMATKAMSVLTPSEISPGANVTDDEGLLASIASGMGTSTAHTCGTAAMAPRDHAGVVSPKLEVYGVTGLSVGDISIIPLIPATHTCATVYAIAEKAADLIKARYKPWLSLEA